MARSTGFEALQAEGGDGRESRESAWLKTVADLCDRRDVILPDLQRERFSLRARGATINIGTCLGSGEIHFQPASS
jgi:hypothetical protein